MKKWRKNIASWKCGKTLYLSVPFTWLLGDAEAMASAHKGKVVAGGPAVALAQTDAPDTPATITWAETPQRCPFDTIAFHNPCATFTTRGCPNRCGFCAVPKIEGGLSELNRWKAAPVICDNNLLAASRRHFSRVVDSLRQFPAVDFNQGLDARRLTSWHLDKLRGLKGVIMRFAFDHVRCEAAVADAIALSRRYGFGTYRVYVLIGFDDTPTDARHRMEKVLEWGALPCPQRYQPLNAKNRNDYVADGWTDYELRKMVRYYYKYRFLKDTPYEDYHLVADSLFSE